MSEAREHFLANLLYLGHAPGIKSGLSPLENLAWYQALSGESGDEEERLEALERVGLAGFEDVPAGQLGRPTASCGPGALNINAKGAMGTG